MNEDEVADMIGISSESPFNYQIELADIDDMYAHHFRNYEV